ncbi:MAG: uroporphyrinogen-III synthase, partial [Geodermatophilales bacterium]|nr:uroporphyrinogen-III synthase [Geodermatophilales bacterium]
MTETLPSGTPDEPETAPGPPLAGYTVAVTAARRKEELGALLDRRG